MDGWGRRKHVAHTSLDMEGREKESLNREGSLNEEGSLDREGGLNTAGGRGRIGLRRFEPRLIHTLSRCGSLNAFNSKAGGWEGITLVT
eukprot:366531-Chlamydomonas_euryale.AAC.10